MANYKRKNMPKGTFKLAAEIYRNKYMADEKRPLQDINESLMASRFYSVGHANSILAVAEAAEIVERRNVEALRIKKELLDKYTDIQS